MSTLNDVMELEGIVWMARELFGAGEEFVKEFRNRFRNLGDIVMAEKDCTVKEVICLPLTTSLGPKAEAEFRSVRDWFYSVKPFSSSPR